MNRRYYAPGIWDEKLQVFRVLTLPDGSGWLDIELQGNGAKLGKSPAAAPGTYEDVWLFETFETALHAAYTWAAEGFGGEPYGWWRHPGSGRRRHNGSHLTEYYEP